MTEEDFPAELDLDAPATPQPEAVTVRGVIEGAVGRIDDLQAVVTMGWYNDGTLYLASSTPHKANIVWLMDCVRHALHTRY